MSYPIYCKAKEYKAYRKGNDLWFDELRLRGGKVWCPFLLAVTRSGYFVITPSACGKFGGRAFVVFRNVLDSIDCYR